MRPFTTSLRTALLQQMRPQQAPLLRTQIHLHTRALHNARVQFQQQHQQQHQQPQLPRKPSQHSVAHGNFYKTHGRALFKTLTLAFFSFQFFYWLWLLFETEYQRDEKSWEIKSLEGEVRLLEEGVSSHQPAVQGQDIVDGKLAGKRLLEEKKA